MKIWGVLTYTKKGGLWVTDDKNYGSFKSRSKECDPRVKAPH